MALLDSVSAPTAPDPAADCAHLARIQPYFARSGERRPFALRWHRQPEAAVTRGHSAR